RTDTPTPAQARLPLMTLSLIVGDAELILMPPPSPKPGVSKPERPFRSVKPLRTEAAPSPELKVATESSWPPSMTVTEDPPSLITVMALPRNLMFSEYTPGATRTVSPGAAAAIADWIAG